MSKSELLKLDPLKKTLVALLLLLLVAPFAASRQDAPKWVTLSPDRSGFMIQVPAQPKEETESKPGFTTRLYTVITDKAIYLVSYGDYAPTMRLDVDGELAANRDNFVKGLPGAKLLTSESVKLDGRPGLEFTGESPQARFRSRVYLAGNRVFMFMALELAGKDDTENVKRFLSSFAFTPQQ